VLKRREVEALVEWRFGANPHMREQALKGIDGPGAWGHARRQIKKALTTPDPMEALDCLLWQQGGVCGWGPAMSSLVLAVCRPDAYTVVDDRVLRSLEALGLFSPRVDGEFDREDWVPCLRTCQRLSRSCKMSLREVDQALWAAANDAPRRPTLTK
jgi:hypothetical protein